MFTTMRNKYFIVNVEAAIYNEDKWLIIKRSMNEEHAPGTLSLVGGKVENVVNEYGVLENTLKREILEEVGVEIYDDMKYIESKAFVASNGEIIVDIVFLCRYKSGEPRPMDKDEVEKVFWMKKEEIMKYEKSPIYLKETILNAEKIK